MPPPNKSGWLELIIKQFEDLLVLILLGSAVVSLILGFLEDKDSYFEIFIEPTVIMLILIANAIVGVWQESSAEEAIEVIQLIHSNDVSTYPSVHDHTYPVSQILALYNCPVCP